MKMKSITITPAYAGGGVNINGITEEGERVIILGADDIILSALNEKGFTLSKEGQERVNRVKIND